MDEPFSTQADVLEILQLIKEQVLAMPEFPGEMPLSIREKIAQLPPEEVLRSAVSVTKKHAAKIVQHAIDVVASYKKEETNEVLRTDNRG